MPSSKTIVTGAGIAGIAPACSLARTRTRTRKRITLVDRDRPMAVTSAQPGEKYRNWRPHPCMTRSTDRSIDLMERIARHSGAAGSS